MKYLKTWMGSIASGYNAGHPTRKFQLIETLDELVRTYDDNADYYKLQFVGVSQAVETVAELEMG